MSSQEIRLLLKVVHMVVGTQIRWCELRRLIGGNLAVDVVAHVWWGIAVDVIGVILWAVP